MTINNKWLFFLFTVAVVIAFFVCWAPYHAQRLMFVYVTLYGQWTENLKFVNQHLFYFAGKQSLILIDESQEMTQAEPIGVKFSGRVIITTIRLKCTELHEGVSDRDERRKLMLSERGKLASLVISVISMEVYFWVRNYSCNFQRSRQAAV